MAPGEGATVPCPLVMYRGWKHSTVIVGVGGQIYLQSFNLLFTFHTVPFGFAVCDCNVFHVGHIAARVQYGEHVVLAVLGCCLGIYVARHFQVWP